jgi:regulator of sigma E protease
VNFLDFIAHNGLGVFVVILCFGFIIFIHELGHFLQAKRVGVRVHEFALGFGPRILMRKKGETEYSLRLFPLGGYVRMEGEDTPAQDSTDNGNFQNRTIWERIKIVVSGPLMNYCVALLIFLFVGFVWGVGDFYGKPIVGSILKDMPAAEMGLKSGDYIVEINGKPINTSAEMIETIHNNPGVEVTLKVIRKEKTEDNQVDFKLITLKAVTREEPVPGSTRKIGLLGFVPEKAAIAVRFTKAPFTRVISESISQMEYYTGAPFLALYLIVSKRIPAKEVKEGSAGPIGIGQMFFEMYKKGLPSLLYLGAMINVFIGCFNLIPFPALDGARIFFLVISAIIRKPFNQEKEGLVHFVGFIILLVVVVFFTYFDILRLIQGKTFFK